MNKGTCKEGLQVARFDRSQPPPGYEVWFDEEWACFCYSTTDDGVSFNDEPIEAEEAIAAAWAHYEREHDPPDGLRGPRKA